MQALCIGKTTYNITVPVDEYPVENMKYILQEKLEGSGGAASNVAYLLGKWNMETYFAGTVGYDENGSAIKKELESGGVHTNFMEVNYEKKTTTTFILANKKTTSRTQIVIEPEVFHLKKYEYDISPTVIYSDGFEYSATVAAYNKYPGIPTILGAGINESDEKEVQALMKYAHYIIFSLEFACKMTKMTVDMNNPQHLLNLYKEVKAKCPNSVNIITLHQYGVLYSVNNEIKVMPTLEVKEVDRTGAGDVFDGAFTYGLGKGYDLEKCIRLANIAAALSTVKYGAKQSIPILSDVIHEYEQKFGSLEVVTNEVPAAENQNTPPTNESTENSQNIPSTNEPTENQASTPSVNPANPEPVNNPQPTPNETAGK